ncbi:MAG TPA: hypothetical protein VHZ55_24330 [Bryobacteraceae bacterium]|nr:hypothetical protein [Bryobacteraceae bacterium]
MVDIELGFSLGSNLWVIDRLTGRLRHHAFGYFHPSCIQRLAKGERLLPDGRVQHAYGTVEENVAVCSYPRYTPTGLPVTAGVATLPEVNGWIENASITTGSANKSYGALIATWTVPPQPLADNGQVLFFFILDLKT